MPCTLDALDEADEEAIKQARWTADIELKSTFGTDINFFEKEKAEQQKRREVECHKARLEEGKWVFTSKPAWEKRTFGKSEEELQVFSDRRDDILQTMMVFLSITSVMFMIVIACLCFNSKSTCRNFKKCWIDFADGVRDSDCSCCKKKKHKKPMPRLVDIVDVAQESKFGKLLKQDIEVA